jgi:hypothetical protein
LPCFAAGVESESVPIPSLAPSFTTGKKRALSVHIVGRIARRPLASHFAFEVVPVFANVRVPRLGQRLQRVGVLL